MFKLSNGVDKIFSSLYIGNVNDLKDQNQLELYKITHVISVHDNGKKGQSDVHYFCISVTDQPNQNLSQFFSQSNDFIHSARIGGGRVMIHYIGSRSLILAGIYVMSSTSLDAKSTFQAFNALKCVRGERPVTNPNDGFLKQLQQFEGVRLKGERRRLFKKFSGQIYQPTDEVEARKLVKLYERSQTQLMNSNYMNIAYGIPAAPKISNWKLMRKTENKEKLKQSLTKEASKSKKQLTIAPCTTSSTKITISSPTKSPGKTGPKLNKLNTLVRSSSGLYLASANKPPSPISPTGGVRRKLAAATHPRSILKKQMSIDSLTVNTASLSLNDSGNGTAVPIASSNLLTPFDQKRKPISAPSVLRSNPELFSNRL